MRTSVDLIEEAEEIQAFLGEYALRRKLSTFELCRIMTLLLESLIMRAELVVTGERVSKKRPAVSNPPAQ